MGDHRKSSAKQVHSSALWARTNRAASGGLPAQRPARPAACRPRLMSVTLEPAPRGCPEPQSLTAVSPWIDRLRTTLSCLLCHDVLGIVEVYAMKRLVGLVQPCGSVYVWLEEENRWYIQLGPWVTDSRARREDQPQWVDEDFQLCQWQSKAIRPGQLPVVMRLGQPTRSTPQVHAQGVSVGMLEGSLRSGILMHPVSHIGLPRGSTVRFHNAVLMHTTHDVRPVLHLLTEERLSRDEGHSIARDCKQYNGALDTWTVYRWCSSTDYVSWKSLSYPPMRGSWMTRCGWVCMHNAFYLAYRNQLLQYSISRDTWLELPTATHYRSFMTIATDEQRSHLYMVGPNCTSCSDESGRSCERFDVHSATWHVMPSMKRVRWGASLIVLDDHLLAFGGRGRIDVYDDKSMVIRKDAERLSLKRLDCWRMLPDVMPASSEDAPIVIAHL